VQVDAYFGPFGDSANLDAKKGARFVPNVPQARKSFWTHFDLFGDIVSIGAR
jgi:hypothetical protein